MMRMLDLYCGGGGAGAGYIAAGWDVVGVDIEDQPLYPSEFVSADALQFAAEHGHEYDAIHASPPCQAHSPTDAFHRCRRRRPVVDLIPATRAALASTGRPYVIENVATRSAGLVDPVVLCGQMFGLQLIRHRGFESNVPLRQPAHKAHAGLAMRNGYLPTAERPLMTITGRNGHHSRAWVRAAATAMGTPWLATALNQVCEAIPPAYTEYIGRELRTAL